MRSRIFRLGIVMAGVIVSLNAQWLNYPEQRTPLTREGRPDLAAKTPRASNKKPDLTGVWQIEPPAPGEIERLYGKGFGNDVVGDSSREQSRYFVNLFIDFKRGEEPITPDAAAQTLRNLQGVGRLDTPLTRCLPYGLPQASRGSVPPVDGIFDRQVGRRYSGRGYGRIQRPDLAGCHRTSA